MSGMKYSEEHEWVLVEGDSAKASLKDGVLEVTLHKVEKSKQKRITIDS